MFRMKFWLIVPALVFSSVVFGAPVTTSNGKIHEVIAVSECKPNEARDTWDWNPIVMLFGGNDGEYKNYRISVLKCVTDPRTSTSRTEVRQVTVDLGFFEDNDHSNVQDNLKARCESKREKLIAQIVSHHHCQ